MEELHEARRLRAEGVKVQTIDGQELRLMFDMDALVIIEEEFGSLGAMQDALNEMGREQLTGKLFKPFLKILRAALAHDPSAANARFDPALTGEYLAAVMRAMNVAFPDTGKDAGATGETNPTTDTSGSRGPTSITSLPSDTGEIPARSGV